MPISAELASAYEKDDGSMTFKEVAFLPVGSVIRIGSSVYRVTAVNAAAKTATVTVLSNDNDHAANATAQIIGNAQIEHKKYEDSATIRRDKKKNFAQIFYETAAVTRSSDYIALVNGQTGVKGEEIDKKLKHLFRQIGRTLWHGVPIEAMAKNDVGMMGGVDWFIRENGHKDSGALTRKNINAFLAALRERGSALPQIWCMPSVAEVFAELMEDKRTIVREDKTVGIHVNRYLSGAGEAIEIVSDPSCLTTNGFYVFDISQLAYRVLCPMAAEDIGKTGLSTETQISTEITMEFRNSQTCGLFEIAA
jgi:hypothetical protein